MRCIVEITKYPLTPDYEAPIIDFITRLKSHADLDIRSFETCTIVHGEYDRVMDILTREIRTSLDGKVRTSFVLKVLNTE